MANNGEYNRRHHAVLRKGHQMVSAVAIGTVVQGDKDDKERTDMLNETSHVDLAELEGDDATGGDCLYEFKVPSALTKGRSEGKGSKPKADGSGGGQPASVGHQYAFGNTEEKYRVMILGCRRRGRTRDKAFNHRSNKGYVARVKGQYFDAIHVKKNRVVPMIIEAQGGITPHTRAAIGHLSRRAKGKGARDSTKYGRSRTSTKSFFVHHSQRLALAAKQYHARAVLKALTGFKHEVVASPAGGGEGAGNRAGAA